MSNFRDKSQIVLFSIFATSIFHLTLLGNVEAIITQGSPFWIPLEFDIGDGYFKTNVSILGLKEDSGLIKVCVIPEAIRHKLCHYMDAQEEGQIIRPNFTVHAGIYAFPSSYIPIDSTLDICITILKDQKTLCKVITNTPEEMEERVYLTLQR